MLDKSTTRIRRKQLRVQT